jgi:hypothetical protein
MLPSRLRECLAILRWRDVELSDATDHHIADVRAWLDGRARPPLTVAAWLEALVKAHLSVPPLAGTRSAPSAIGPDKPHTRASRPGADA